jgi:transcriptional regulator with XRE-family HTH domain
MPGRDWRKEANWDLSVKEIAELYGVSQQRVHQVRKNLGIPFPQKISAKFKILGLDTSNLTKEQVAAIAKCSPSYAAAVMKANGKAYKRTINVGFIESQKEFVNWLIIERKYPRKVARDICFRCRKVEASLGIKLISQLHKNGGLSNVISRIKEEFVTTLKSTLSLPNRPATYRYAVKRYWEFLSAQGTAKKEKREKSPYLP